MKIIIFAPANNVHTHKWIDYYNSKGYDILNVSFSNHKGEHPGKWENVKTVYLKLRVKSKLGYFFTVNQLKHILEREKPDIFHAHYVSSYGLIGALVSYHPYVISVWGIDIYDFPKQNIFNKQLVKYALGKADAICSTSEVMKSETAKYTNKDIIVTPFGVDIDKFKPIEDNSDKGTVTIGIVKTMKEKYGIEYLIRAYHLLQQSDNKKVNSTRLVIVGGGPSLDQYKALSRELQLEDKITFTGNVSHDEVPKMINQFDIFVVPSIYDSESFGVAAVEAQACGVPVIVSEVGGLPEVIKEGETGYIVPKMDYHVLAEKIQYLVINKELRKEMGVRGREHVVRKYNWTENAEIMIRLYGNLLH